MCFIVTLLIDALLLMALLKAFNDDEGSMLSAGALALGTSIVLNLVVYGLAPVLGLMALPIAISIAGLLLGVCISAIFGVEIMRSFMIAGIFILIRLAYGFALALMIGL